MVTAMLKGVHCRLIRLGISGLAKYVVTCATGYYISFSIFVFCMLAHKGTIACSSSDVMKYVLEN